MHQTFCKQLGIIVSLYYTGQFGVFYDALLLTLELMEQTVINPLPHT